MTDVVVVGASVAGVHVAESLRSAGHLGRIVLVGDEDHLPYDKPALSKVMLTGDWDPAAVSLLPEDRREAMGIELMLGRPATGLDTERRRVLLADGTSVGYDRVVLATGSTARRAAWVAGDGIVTLRGLDDSARLRRTLMESERVVVVGGGFIGAEVAAAARARGCDVTVVDLSRAPLAGMLGEDVGARLSDIHARHGVRARYGVHVTDARGSFGDVHLDLSDGSTLSADLVVAGLGAEPNTAWLADSGLPLDDGVLCDPYCRVDGQEDVFAAGDVARWLDARTGAYTRVEHWTNAVEQAACVAHNIVTETPTSYEPLFYVWSDQYDWKIQFIATAGERSHHDVIGDLDAATPRAVVTYGDAGNSFVGALALNLPHALMQARRLLRHGSSYSDALRTLRDATLEHLG